MEVYSFSRPQDGSNNSQFLMCARYCVRLSLVAVTARKHAAQGLAHSRSPQMPPFLQALSCGPLGRAHESSSLWGSWVWEGMSGCRSRHPSWAPQGLTLPPSGLQENWSLSVWCVRSVGGCGCALRCGGCRSGGVFWSLCICACGHVGVGVNVGGLYVFVEMCVCDQVCGSVSGVCVHLCVHTG